MKINWENTPSGSSLTMDGELTIYNVTMAKSMLLDDIQNTVDPIALDLANVSDIDTAGVQLLLFSKKIFSENNKHLYLSKSNEHVDTALKNFDVAAYFNLEK